MVVDPYVILIFKIYFLNIQYESCIRNFIFLNTPH
jgi:hypothetical protein